MNLIVTAEDGTQKLYRVRVSREAAAAGSGGTGKDANTRLASLQLAGAQLTPAFDPGVLEYEAKLAANVSLRHPDRRGREPRGRDRGRRAAAGEDRAGDRPRAGSG